jgi:uncharacterized protein YbjT (DUF2867 family)
MAEPFHVVCGATGHVGGIIASRLLDAKKKVRVVGRSADRLAPLAARGAEAAAGSMEDPAFLLGGLEGGQGVLLGAGPAVLVVEETEASHLADDGGEHLRDLLVGRRLDRDEPGRPRAGEVEDAVRHEGMEVDVQVDGTVEALDRGDAAGPQIGHPEPPGPTPLPGEEGPGEDVE